jgi:SagB-type dehydrogenase family enzyme
MRALALSLLAAVLMGQEAPKPEPIKLPAPKIGTFSLDQALKERQSTRNLRGPALSIETLSQLLWSAQGTTTPGKRTVPSASARYPLELYVAVAKSVQLPEGVYKYSPKDHTITKIKDGSPDMLFGFIANQAWVPKAPAIFIFAGVADRMGGNDLIRKELLTYWESGAATQALCMQVAACGLGATVVAGVDLEAVKRAAGLPAEEKISVIVPVGSVPK